MRLPFEIWTCLLLVFPCFLFRSLCLQSPCQYPSLGSYLEASAVRQPRGASLQQTGMQGSKPLGTEWKFSWGQMGSTKKDNIEAALHIKVLYKQE
ncbi:hypothetical protein MHYP_G00273190 [Metynnis hypsauchen]